MSIVAQMEMGSISDIIVDHRKHVLYWVNVHTNSVEKVDFNGQHEHTYWSPEIYTFILNLVSQSSDESVCVSILLHAFHFCAIIIDNFLLLMH